MVSLTQALSIALSGLQTTQSLIALSSKNISNANTEGYTVKTATVADVDYGSQFGGVGINHYNRASNDALTADYNTATSAANYASTQNQYISQIQAILDSSSTSPTLATDIANFSSAWSSYSASPESSTTKQTLIAAGQKFAQDINTITSNVGTLKTQVESDITTSVNTVNATLKSIAALNKQLQQATTSGQQTVDLQDSLDAQVLTLSKYMNVQVQTRANGQIAVYTPSGQVLVDEQTPKQYTYNGTSILDNNGTDVTGSMSGGSLQAAIDFVSTSTTSLSSTTSGVGTIGKIDAQLAKLCDAFTNSSGSTPSTFATAYTAAITSSTASGATQYGQTLASSFFTVTNDSSGNPDPTTFAVNSLITAGTDGIPQTGTQAIANSFGSTATYTASGLNAANVTYAGLTNAILSNFQQDANSISTMNATASSQQTYYKQTLADQTGVNTDTELAHLVTYQNSYAASAHVMSTINQMLSSLMSILQ